MKINGHNCWRHNNVVRCLHICTCNYHERGHCGCRPRSLQWILTCHSNAMSNVATGDRSFQNGEKLLVESWAKSTTFPHSPVTFLEEYRKTATKNVNCSLYMYNGLKSLGSDNYCQHSPARDTMGYRAVVEPSGFTSALCTREIPHHGMPQYC